jgi:Lon protease-like protein
VLASDKGIVNTGCTAVVEKILKKYEDGRMDVLASGRRRFEIVLLNDDKSYLRGAVEFFDDDEFEPIPPGVKERVLEGYNDLCQIDPPEPLLDPELADAQLSFQLAQALSDLNFRQMLLATRSESERMKKLAEFLPAFNSRQRQIAHVKAVAPNNGHGKWPPAL